MGKKGIIQKIISIIIVLTMFLLLGIEVYASNEIELKVRKVEYSDEYKEYLELDDEEKAKVLEPRKYDIITSTSNSNYLKSMNNIFKMSSLLRSNVYSSYDLRSIIPENTKIRNQYNTGACWAFASIGTLETTLALADNFASNPVTTYDFSEKHMVYGTARYAFLNNAKNEYGIDKDIDGGNFLREASMYLTNGMGAIPEGELQFEDSTANIDISQIQGKTVSTTVEDTVLFPAPDTEVEREELISKMKQHITNYGGLFAAIYGANMFSDYYNNETGAIYCDIEQADHAVTIIGWNDSYSKGNFNSKKQPTSNGAWIVKNSWGETGELEESLTEIKTLIYDYNTDELNQEGIYSASEVTNEIVIYVLEKSYGEGKISIDGEKIYYEVGNKGYMYISYEDANVYNALAGIESAKATKDYYNIYQNDILGVSSAIYLGSEQNPDNHVYLANVFTRDSSVEEWLDKISIYTLQEYKNCKVYVNPNGNSKSLNDLIEVELEEGEQVTIKPGYRTLKFANPIKLQSNSFVVVVEIQTEIDMPMVTLESKSVDGYEETVVNTGESFYATSTSIQNNQWGDISLIEDYETGEKIGGNLNIKAFTTDEGEVVLSSIQITHAPTNLEYTEGENFDTTGMIVIANYSDGKRKEITNYTVVDGNNLTTNKTTVTISYTENGVTKTTTQAITVNSDDGELELPDDGTNTIPDDGGNTIPDDDVEVIPPTEERQPVSSDFENASANIENAKIYFYTDSTYIQMKIKISNIKIGDEENQYTYYYYLSGTQGDNNIPENSWKQAVAKEEADGTYSITINIDSREIENFEEISESENLFIYIKEIAEIDNISKELISVMQVESNIEPDIYIDDEMIGNIDDIISGGDNITIDGNDNKSDNTLAPGKIPQTGIISISIALIAIIAVVGVVSYNRFRKIDK